MKQADVGCQQKGAKRARWSEVFPYTHDSFSPSVGRCAHRLRLVCTWVFVAQGVRAAFLSCCFKAQNSERMEASTDPARGRRRYIPSGFRLHSCYRITVYGAAVVPFIHFICLALPSCSSSSVRQNFASFGAAGCFFRYDEENQNMDCIVHDLHLMVQSQG